MEIEIRRTPLDMRRKRSSELRSDRLRDRISRLEARVDELTEFKGGTKSGRARDPEAPSHPNALISTTKQVDSAIEPLAEIAQQFVPGQFKISAFTESLYLETRYVPSKEFNRALEVFRREFSVGVILRPLGFGLPEDPIRVLNRRGVPEN